MHSEMAAVLIEILWNCQKELFSARWLAAATGRGKPVSQRSDDTSGIFRIRTERSNDEDWIKKNTWSSLIGMSNLICLNYNIISEQKHKEEKKSSKIPYWSVTQSLHLGKQNWILQQRTKLWKNEAKKTWLRTHPLVFMSGGGSCCWGNPITVNIDQ